MRKTHSLYHKISILSTVIIFRFAHPLVGLQKSLRTSSAKSFSEDDLPLYEHGREEKLVHGEIAGSMKQTIRVERLDTDV